jgi:hypothetical protein
LIEINKVQPLDFLSNLGLVVFSGETFENTFNIDIAKLSPKWREVTGKEPVVLAKENDLVDFNKVAEALVKAKF